MCFILVSCRSGAETGVKILTEQMATADHPHLHKQPWMVKHCDIHRPVWSLATERFRPILLKTSIKPARYPRSEKSAFKDDPGATIARRPIVWVPRISPKLTLEEFLTK
jgi:hypothetical protein